MIEVEREHLLKLIQTDTELSDILMRAFILRRVELISHRIGDVVVLGSTYSPETLRIREFLTRNGYPHGYVDLDQDPDAQELLDHFHVGVQDVPVVICRGEVVLRNPINGQIADCLGFNEAIDRTHLRDLVVVAPAQPDLPLPFMAHRKDWTCWFWNPKRRVDKPDRARKLKTISVFRLAFPVKILPVALTPRRKNSACKS